MVNITKLSNGLTVVMEQMDYLRSVSFGVWVKVGSANETVENNGIAHVIEHMFFKGTQNRTAKQLADDCALIGGNLNAYTSKECTSYYVTTLDTHLPKAIEIVSDMVKHSLFDPEDLEKEKGVIIDEINMYEDSPDDLVHELLQKEVWKDQSIGYIISGEIETVEGFTREQLLQFVNDYYTADNIVISLAGNFNEREVLSLLEENFGDLPSTSNYKKVERAVYHRTFIEREKDIEQVHMNLAFDCIDYHTDEKYVLSIVNSIIGGGENSRLFQVIREELGLSYSIYSYASSYDNGGLFHVDASLNPGNVMQVLKKTIEIIEELKKTGVNEYDLTRAKEQINTELIIGSESSRNRMNGNGKALLCRDRLNSLDETVEKINQVSVEDVTRFMHKYFCVDMVSVCLIGNTSEAGMDEIRAYWNSLKKD